MDIVATALTNAWLEAVWRAQSARYQPPGMDRAEFLGQWSRFNAIVHGIVERMDGSIAAEHGVGLIKRDELARTADPVGLDLMRRLKAALDPHDLLNPGKVVALSDDPPPALPV